MYKCIIEYAKINKGMKLKFNIILKDDKQAYGLKLVDKFNLNGVDYLKINPHPYLTIDISSNNSKGENWSSNKTITLNQQGVFMAKRRLREVIDSMGTEDLFVYVRDRLCVDKDIANELTTKFVTSNKHVLLRPVVVYDDDDPTIEYEGICLMINTVDNYCNMTLDEAEYLYDLLDRINLTETALSVINTSVLLKTMHTKKIESQPKTFVENKKEDESIDVNFSTEKADDSLPEI